MPVKEFLPLPIALLKMSGHSQPAHGSHLILNDVPLLLANFGWKISKAHLGPVDLGNADFVGVLVSLWGVFLDVVDQLDAILE